MNNVNSKKQLHTNDFFSSRDWIYIRHYLGVNMYRISPSNSLEMAMVSHWIDLNINRPLDENQEPIQIYEDIYSGLEIPENDVSKITVVNTLVQFLGTEQGIKLLIKEWAEVGENFLTLIKNWKSLDFNLLKTKRKELFINPMGRGNSSYYISSYIKIREIPGLGRNNFEEKVYHRFFDWIFTAEGLAFLVEVYSTEKSFDLIVKNL